MNVQEIEKWMLSTLLVRKVRVSEVSGAELGPRWRIQYEAAPEARKETEKKRVEFWNTVWDEHYSAAHVDSVEFNIEAWKSSYTNEPIPFEEMREWVDGTVARIRDLHLSSTAGKGGRILEIGSGSGLLLHRLWQCCSEFVATDNSAAALQLIRTGVDRNKISNVKLINQSATELEASKLGSFDTIIINSVAQYFPSLTYLEEVLSKVIPMLNPGGALILGDLRNYALLEPFISSVQISASGSKISSDQLRLKIERACLREAELLYDPRWFHFLPERFSDIDCVSTELRRGKAWNEMSAFRYDAIIWKHENSEASLLSDELIIKKWCSDLLDLDGLRRELVAADTNALIVEGIPNERVFDSVASYNELIGRDVDADRATKRIHPETVWNLATETGWQVRISWSPRWIEGDFAAIFIRPGQDWKPVLKKASFMLRERVLRPANEPNRRSLDSDLGARLRAKLEDAFPELSDRIEWIPLENIDEGR